MRVDGHRAAVGAAYGGGRQGSRDVLHRAQEAVRILDAGFSCQQSELRVDVVFTLVHRQAERVPQVGGIVEDVHGGEGIIPSWWRHCAGARMQL